MVVVDEGVLPLWLGHASTKCILSATNAPALANAIVNMPIIKRGLFIENTYAIYYIKDLDLKCLITHIVQT